MKEWYDFKGKHLGWIADARVDREFATKPFNKMDAILTEAAQNWLEQTSSASVSVCGYSTFITINSYEDRLYFKLRWL
jgi:hypothetical protein